MRTDLEIRKDVESELQWDPSVDDRKIGVIVNKGVVTLTGEVEHYAGRWSAENSAKRVVGVRAIANEIQVQIPSSLTRSDSQLAEAAADALRWHVLMASEPVKAVVRNGWITLIGEVGWGFQRTAAENAVRHLIGVRGVANEITIASAVTATDVKRQIEEAFRRHAQLEAKDIDVKVDHATVILNGHVHTWQEREDAAFAAWAAPGVVRVDNRLTIQ